MVSDEKELAQSATPDAADTARQAGLVYVSDEAPGYRRKPWGRGFTYLTPAGEHVQDKALRAYFETLAIPPAWTDVWICMDPRGHIQATGRDDRDRKQYIYHPDWARARNAAKFDRLRSFGEALSALRARVDEDLRRRKLSREKVLAVVVALLDETLIRIGNREYARRNDSYGLTTLRTHHLAVDGTTLRFEFTGKSGKAQEVELRDRRLARMVKRLQELPGQQLFQYVTEDGDCCEAIASDDVNAYLRDITGLDITAKDFRTWGGSVLALDALARLGPAADETATTAHARAAVKEVAAALGNTVAVCRDYYIHPAVFAAYADGTLFDALEAAADSPDDRLAPVERALLHLLA